MEEWKDIEGFEKAYQVSTWGRVKSLKRFNRKEDRILSTCPDSNGYIKTCLSKDGVKITPRVHRLVAIAFISNPESKPCVDHRDGNKANNSVTNLRWSTYSENEKHSCRVLGKVPYQAKVNEDDVKEIRRLYPSMTYKALGEKYSICKSAVFAIVKGINWPDTED